LYATNSGRNTQAIAGARFCRREATRASTMVEILNRNGYRLHKVLSQPQKTPEADAIFTTFKPKILPTKAGKSRA